MKRQSSILIAGTAPRCRICACACMLLAAFLAGCGGGGGGHHDNGGGGSAAVTFQAQLIDLDLEDTQHGTAVSPGGVPVAGPTLTRN